MKTVGEIAREWAARGVTLVTPPSKKFDEVFPLRTLFDDQQFGILTKAGWLHRLEKDGSKTCLGNLQHKDFGYW